MTEIASLAQILLVTAAVAAPIVVLVRFIHGHEPIALSDVASPSGRAPWPRGVQEEDPIPWGVVEAR